MKRATLERAFENLVERPSDVAIRQKAKRAFQLIHAYLKREAKSYQDIKRKYAQFMIMQPTKKTTFGVVVSLRDSLPKAGLLDLRIWERPPGFSTAGSFTKRINKTKGVVDSVFITLFPKPLVKRDNPGMKGDLESGKTLADIFKSMERVFIHEYTHALDFKKQAKAGHPLRPSDYRGSLSSQPSMQDYFNNPTEIQSYLTEYMYPSFKALTQLAKRVEQKPETYRYVKHMIQATVSSNFRLYWKLLVAKSQSTTFGKFLKALTPKNKKRVIGRAYTVWQELKKRGDEILKKWPKPKAKENIKMKEGMQAIAAKLFKENYACTSEESVPDTGEDNLTVEDYNKRSEALAEAVGELQDALSTLQGVGSGLAQAFLLVEGTPGYSEDHKSLMAVLKDINEAGCKVFGLTQQSCHDLSVLEKITKKLRESKRPY